MTYRVIICDDEPYIAEATEMLLRTHSKWDFDIARFYSPRQTMARIEEGRIDILIVDIRMPGMSGLDIMRRTVSLWPAAYIILLTAHPDFTYIYDAIKHDQVTYVLKSEGHTALLCAVERAVDKLERTFALQEVVENAHSRMSEALPLLQRELILDLIHGISFTDEQLSHIKERLHLPLDETKSFSLWTILIQTYNKEDDTFLDRNDRLHAVTTVIRHYLTENIHLLSILLDSQRILFLAQADNNGALSSAQLEGALDGAQQAAANQLHLPFAISYTSRVEKLSQIKDAYDMIKAVQLSMASTNNELWLINAENHVPNHQATRWMDAQYPAMAKLFRHAFENGDPSAIKQLDALLLPIEHATETAQPETLEMYTHLAIEVAKLFRSGNGAKLTDSGISLQHLLCLSSHKSPQAAAHYIRSAVQLIEQVRSEHASSSMQSIVSTVTAYITEHLHEDISLITLADIAGVNASYLSRLFKRITGETLSSYIATLKMNEAYRLLQGRDRILDISKALGFPTPAYFSFFFKKNAGMTPSEYRGERR